MHIYLKKILAYICICVCVCVCERERKRERLIYLEENLSTTACGDYLVQELWNLDFTINHPPLQSTNVRENSQFSSGSALWYNLAHVILYRDKIEGKAIWNNFSDCLSLGITADGDCSHEIKRRLLLGRKVMTNLDSISKAETLLCQQRSC